MHLLPSNPYACNKYSPPVPNLFLPVARTGKMHRSVRENRIHHSGSVRAGQIQPWGSRPLNGSLTPTTVCPTSFSCLEVQRKRKEKREKRPAPAHKEHLSRTCFQGITKKSPLVQGVVRSTVNLKKLESSEHGQLKSDRTGPPPKRGTKVQLKSVDTGLGSPKAPNQLKLVWKKTNVLVGCPKEDIALTTDNMLTQYPVLRR